MYKKWNFYDIDRENIPKVKTGIEKFKITKQELKNKKLPKQALIDWLGEGWE